MNLHFNEPVYYKITNMQADAEKRFDPNSQPTPEQLDLNMKKMQDLEKYLYLCIQLPVTNESSIVVLEG